jgi:hypothetical protein
MKTMNFQERIYKNVLGTLSAQELQRCAESLAAQGKDSPSLTKLIILDSPYSEDAKVLFEKAVKEFGYAIPTQEEAAMGLVQGIADSIVNGELSEFEGALKIWKEVLDVLEKIPDDLWVFKSEASLIESCMADFEEHGSDHTDLINQSKANIMSAAQLILQKP